MLLRIVDRREVQRARRVDWRQRAVTGWAGFRGAVSLAAAIAVPTTTHSGAPFPDRSLIIFVVSFVILMTVLVQGSTLPAVVRWARIPDDVAHAEELRLARARGAQAALDALPVVAAEVGVSEELQNRLQRNTKRHAALVMAGGDGSAERQLARAQRSDSAGAPGRARTQAPRHHRLRDQRRIDDIVLLELQRDGPRRSATARPRRRRISVPRHAVFTALSYSQR